MRDFAESFYKSKEWAKTREAYLTSRNHICERCGDIAVICHHRKHITPANINDPEITLSFNNLEALCRQCHQEEHTFHKRTDYRKEIAFDENGNLTEVKRHIIVTGAPGSGKTTYVMNQKTPEDIVIDLDFIGCALYGYDHVHENRFDIVPLLLDIRDAIYESLSKGRSNYRKAFIITTENNEAELSRLSMMLNADIVKMETPMEECKNRVRSDKTRPNKWRYMKLIDKWFKNEA